MNRTIAIFLAAFVLAASCSKTAEPVAIGDVCAKPQGTLVSTDGYLVLPNYMTTKIIYGKRENTKTYQLFLVAQPDAKGASVRTIVSGKADGEPNGISELPATGYTFRDLRIHTDDGTTVGPATRLKVTGKVTPASEGTCDLAVTRIETAQSATGSLAR